MAVLTISREFGSGGSSIARQVAHTLGYRFVDKQTIEKVLIEYGFVEFRQEYDSVPGFWASFDLRRAEMMEMLNRVILALAKHGDVVILGRGSFAVLAGFVDVLNVRIQAPLPIRVRRVMAQQKIVVVSAAEAKVKENDLLRATFIESLYGVKWDTASVFDLVIDTHKIYPELAVGWLAETAQALSHKETTSSDRTADRLQVDGILAAAVANVLDHQTAPNR